MDNMWPSRPPPPWSLPLRRMTRIEFEKLAAQGMFDNERVELVFGVVVNMPPIDAAHGESVDRLALLCRFKVRSFRSDRELGCRILAARSSA
jgi:hypothetical protein